MSRFLFNYLKLESPRLEMSTEKAQYMNTVWAKIGLSSSETQLEQSLLVYERDVSHPAFAVYDCHAWSCLRDDYHGS